MLLTCLKGLGGSFSSCGRNANFGQQHLPHLKQSLKTQCLPFKEMMLIQDFLSVRSGRDCTFLPLTFRMTNTTSLLLIFLPGYPSRSSTIVSKTERGPPYTAGRQRRMIKLLGTTSSVDGTASHHSLSTTQYQHRRTRTLGISRTLSHRLNPRQMGKVLYD